MLYCDKVKSLSCVQFFVTLWTVTFQTPLSMGFSRQEYWSKLLCHSPGDLPNPGIRPMSLSLLHWQAGSLPLVPPGNSKKKGLIWILNLVPLIPRRELYPVDQPASCPMLMVMLMAIY